METNEKTTITAEALDWFTSLAEEAVEDLQKLPESSQPIWFRTITH